MSNRYDPASCGFDDIAYRRLTPRTATTSLPEPTSHERDMLRRQVEDMAAEIRRMKNETNLNDLGQGLLGAAAKSFRDNPDEDGSNEVEAYINRRLHAQPPTEQTAATTGGSSSNVGAHHANTRGDGTIGNITGGDVNRFGMQATGMMGGATTGGGNASHA
ncbi:hypothetical protein KC339_g6198, partial [Hortaea werneckii]